MKEIMRRRVLSLLGPMEIVRAVDPGDKTGLVSVCGGFQTVTHNTLDYDSWLLHLDLLAPGGAIVCEQFVSRPMAFARNQVAPRVCGSLDFFCRSRRASLIYQSPQVIKTMMPDADLFQDADWDWSTPHELDAIKHLVYYLITRKQDTDNPDSLPS